MSVTSVRLRDLPKVKYTGTRGRPRQLLPGEADPHAEERKRIEERLDGTNVAVVGEGDIATLDQVRGGGNLASDAPTTY